MRTIFSSIKAKLFNQKGAKYSFAQAGEDIVLQRIFLGKKKGFYVDVGAYHPFRLSNTYLFYLNGWNGINIEPRPGSGKLFQKYRPKDINLEVGISDVNEILNYHIFEEDTLNHFASDSSSTIKQFQDKVIPIKTVPLSSVLDEYGVEKIDFISIDTEGGEHRVLISHNWADFSPTVVLVEQRSGNQDFGKIQSFLKGCNYKEAYRLPVNSCADSVFFLKE